MPEQYKVNGVLYRLQYRKCGKAGCTCQTGEGHGPYWYSYDGQSAAKYVGKQLPAFVTENEKMLKAAAGQIKKLEADLTKKRDEHFRQYELFKDQLRALQGLRTGEHVDPTRLIQLGLSQFNGHGSGK